MGTIAYSDYENLLRKAQDDASIPHIHKVNHKIALLIEKHYKENLNHKRFINNYQRWESNMSWFDKYASSLYPPAEKYLSKFRQVEELSFKEEE